MVSQKSADARVISQIAALLATDSRADFRKACRIAGSINDDHLYALIEKRFPYLTNYDAEGNWVGPIAHENGWTA